MKLIKQLTGFSGCKLFLYSSDEGYFVRKISKSLEYNDRLRSQMQKQKFFHDNLSTDKISTPNIIASGFEDNLFYFDMEYISGFTLIDKIKNSNTQELSEISQTILDIIHIMKENKLGNTFELSEKVASKLKELKSKVSDNQKDLLDELEKRSINMPKLEGTSCHGDLTLENIMYDEANKKYYLIDFLDNFVDHYWFDVVKLFQDIDEEWYLFKNPSLDRINTKTKMNFIREIILKELDESYLNNHSILMALTFFRIIPYAAEKDYPFLMSVIIKNAYQNP